MGVIIALTDLNTPILYFLLFFIYSENDPTKNDENGPN